MIQTIFGWMKEKRTKPYWFITLLFHSPSIAFSQDEIYRYFQLDSVVIEASKSDLDINNFIQYMIDDKSFYKAFKNLRTANYLFQNDVSLYKQDQEVASYSSKAKQIYTTPCRSMIEWDRKTTGDIHDKRGEYQYFTMKLYDRLFFTHGLFCDTIHHSIAQPNSKMERYITELKILMFDPGSETHIPLMGSKTNIFDTEMVKYYDYSLTSTTLQGLDCFLFRIEVKKEYDQHKEGKTVIKKILTWFDKGNKQIVKREYDLRAKTLAYSFDVHMDVDIAFKNNVYYPTQINYNGSWKVIGRKRENAKFRLSVSEFN